MTEQKYKTARYKAIVDVAGSRYSFFCGLSGAVVCTTPLIRKNTQEEELKIAWEEHGRHHFNQCQQCGKWVCNVMYNPDVLKCVACAPIEQQPNYCQYCGVPVSANDQFCRQCGARLMYGEVTDV